MISSFLAILVSASLQQQLAANIAEVSSSAETYKAMLQRLQKEKDAISATSTSQADRMRALEDMQVRGAKYAQNEKKFVEDARERLKKAGEKLESLEGVTNPDKESLLQLASARKEIRMVNAELAHHFLKFSRDFPKPKDLPF